MKRFDWRTFLVLLALLSTTAFAAEVIFEETDEDLFFYNEVLIDGVDLPEDFGANTLESSVDFLGTGSLTVAYQTGGGYPRVTVFGGTTITSERKWSDDDGDDKTAWDGLLGSPLIAKNPATSDIVFVTEGNHEFSVPYPVSAFQMGVSNEEFQFSIPARFTFKVELPDGKKVWYGYKETKAPGEEVEWRITEGDFCIVKNGLCTVDLDELNAVVLAQEFFTKCPRSRSSDTEIKNGFINGTPTCDIECNKGYELNESGNGCVVSEGSVDGGEDFISSPVQEKVVTKIPQGYVRYTGAGDQLRRKLDPSVLEGSERDQIERQNASLLKTVSHGEEEVVVEEENNDDGFLNYLLQIRNYFGENAAQNTFSESAVTDEENEVAGENNKQMEGVMHSSAPLLPSTGPGIFVGLAALGLGLMVFGAKGRR